MGVLKMYRINTHMEYVTVEAPLNNFSVASCFKEKDWSKS